MEWTSNYNGNCLAFNVSGEYSLNGLKTLINAAIKKRKKTTAEKLLFDLSKTSFKHFVETDRYDIGTFVANSFTNEIQAAFIIPKGYRNNLMDYIANKRGAYVKTFDKVESAEKWLLHDY